MIIAQIKLGDRCGNEYVLHIRLVENEITYRTGNSALSNHFDTTKLRSVYNGQSNAEIVQDAIDALLHDSVMHVEIADTTIWTIKDGYVGGDRE